MEKVLVYIGIHWGYSIRKMVSEFDRVIAIDPLPKTKEYLQPLLNEHKHMEYYPVAADTKYGTREFNVAPNECSSSVLELDGNQEHWKKIEVDTVDILDFLKNKLRIENIDVYVSDIQGQDYNILKHLEECYVVPKKINTIKTETYSDNMGQIYKGSNNRFSLFNAMLSDNYDVSQIEDDGRIVTLREATNIILSSDNNMMQEFDVIWTKK